MRGVAGGETCPETTVGGLAPGCIADGASPYRSCVDKVDVEISFGTTIDNLSTRSVGAAMFSSQYQALLHAGDLAYNLDSNNGRVGDRFLDQIEPIASRLPYM